MALKNRKLACLAMAGGWSNWIYRDYEDTMEEMTQVGYFNQINALVATGDIIYLVAKDTVKIMYIYLQDGVISLKELGQ